MKNLVTVIFILFSSLAGSLAHAEYRVFVLLLSNTKNASARQIQTTLDPEQYKTFKHAADGQMERIRLAEERKRFEEAVKPVDELLNNVSTTKPTEPETPVEDTYPFPASQSTNWPMLDPDQELPSPANVQSNPQPQGDQSIFQSFSTPQAPN